MLLPLLLNLNMLGGGGNSAALSGVSSAVQAGNLTPNITIALTGVSSGGQLGTLAPKIDVAATTIASPGATGTLTPSSTVPVTGVATPGQLGTLSPGQTLPLTGVAGAGQTGLLAPSTDAPLVGITSQGQVGNITPSNPDITIALTGISTQGQLGLLTPSGADAPVTQVASNPGSQANAPRIRGGNGWPEEKDLSEVLEPTPKPIVNKPAPIDNLTEKIVNIPPVAVVAAQPKPTPSLRSLTDLLGKDWDQLKAETPTLSKPRVVASEEAPPTVSAPPPVDDDSISWEDMLILLSAL